MRAAAVLLALALPQASFAACRDAVFDGASFTACEVAANEDLRLFLSGPDGVYGGFGAVDAALETQGLRLGFAMNAGMFHPDYAPVGLYVEEGREVASIVTSDGPGNFGLLPNGVFCMTEAADSGPTYQIIESRAFAADPPGCRFATQSGPMLVIDGDLHPRFLEASPSVHIRNGVGVSADGSRAVFVIANQAVNFHLFARYFRDGLGLPQALYFDGSVSRLHAPDIGRSDAGFPIGPIVGTVVAR